MKNFSSSKKADGCPNIENTNSGNYKMEISSVSEVLF